MGVPTSGSFSMFGNSDNTTIQGAITEGGGSVSSVDNLNALIAASNVSLFNTTYSGDLSGSLSNVTNAIQYRGYPATSTAFEFTYTFPAGQTYAAAINLPGTSSEYNATWTWGDGATTSITDNSQLSRTIADNSGGGSTSTYNGNVVGATTEGFPQWYLNEFNVTDIFLIILVLGFGSVVRCPRGLAMFSGFKVQSITDVTPIPHNGCRPPKKRRV